MSDLHRRTAERLLDLCGRNGGAYVKLGQHLSQLDFVLPNEFIEVLRSMLDQVMRHPLICSIISRSTGSERIVLAGHQVSGPLLCLPYTLRK